MNILKDGLCCNSACRADEIQAHIDGQAAKIDRRDARIAELERALSPVVSDLQEWLKVEACENTQELIANGLLALQSSPAQSLANLKADAIDEAVKHVNSEVTGRVITGLFTEYADELREEAGKEKRHESFS